MAFLGEESVWAGAAAECASEQDRFWEYHDALFRHTAGRDQGVFTPSHLKQYAREMALDTDSFASCVDPGRYQGWIRSQTELGRELGVTRTPTLVVNGRLSPVPADFDS